MPKRPVFQDVTADTPRPALSAGGLIDTAPKGARRAIRAWLIVSPARCIRSYKGLYGALNLPLKVQMSSVFQS